VLHCLRLLLVQGGYTESTSPHLQLEPVQRPNTRLSKGIHKPRVYTDGPSAMAC
jgi:hypothetical protein